MNKLDNVDPAKENRYRHVYFRLEDFENYMRIWGINVDLSDCALRSVSRWNSVLLNKESENSCLSF